MKAIQITETGGPDVLALADVPAPSPNPDQVLVKVAYAGVNYIDTYYREGIYHSELPFVPGLEGCGEVVEDPAGEIAPGTVVAWDSAPGSYAEYVCVERGRLVAVPDSIEPRVAATMLLQGITAHYLLYGVRDTQQGDSLLITAGAGGVGLLLTQLAAAQGAVSYTHLRAHET